MPDHPSHIVCPANVLAAFISEDYFYPINLIKGSGWGDVKDNADYLKNWATQFPGNISIMFIF